MRSNFVVKSLYLLMALLLTLLPVGTVLGAPSLLPLPDALQSGADRLTALQNDDGGWDWPLDDGNPTTGSATNTIAPIGMGLARAYEETGDASHLAALSQAGAFLLAKSNFASADGYLAAELDAVFGGTTYCDHLNTGFYGPLAAGTYNRSGTLYDTASYVTLIRNSRANSGIGNLAAWDLGMALVAAASCGADTTEWVAGVKAEIDELDGSAYYDVLGLAGAVYGLAFVGEDYDPTAGEHVAASSVADLAGILSTYQISTGGFTWNSNYMDPNSDEAIQETAYAVLALNQVNATIYQSEIKNAAIFIRNVQLGTGGWGSYLGSSENNEITAEALWALSYEPVSIPVVVYGGSTTPANGSILETGPSQIVIEFNEEMKSGAVTGSAEDTTNYLLVEAGANGVFDTTSCAVPGSGAAAVDDVVVTIDSAVYTSGSFLATISINGGAALPVGDYRLFICGTTSIESIADVELNDGVSDSLLDFSVIAVVTVETPSELPSTGFPHGSITALPTQPADKVYSETRMMLNITDLDVSIPIVGVPQSASGWDVTWLGDSAGYLDGSAFPTWAGNTVITGHVWNAYNQPGPFADLKTLRYGDEITIQAWGSTYVYEVRESQLVSPGRVNTVMGHEDLDWLTLITCEFYNPFTGNYLSRRVVRAVLVDIQ